MKICVLSATTKRVICHVSDLLHNDNVCFLVHSAHVITLSNLSSWYLFKYLVAAHNHQVVNVECMTSLWEMRSCTMISMKCTLLVMMVSTADFTGTWDSLCTRYWQHICDQGDTRKVLLVSPISERAVLDISGTMKKHNSIIIRSAANSHTPRLRYSCFLLSNRKSNMTQSIENWGEIDWTTL